MQNKAAFFFMLMSIALLQACDSQTDSLKSYIQSVKKRSPTQISPLPNPVPYQQFAYPKTQVRDPFVRVAARGLSSQPDLQRHKEPLEAFTLDSLRMVGTVMQDNRLWAVISAPDGAVYRVSAGGYIGQNYGQVKKVNAKELLLEESFDVDGEWEKRQTKLSLVEGDA